LISSNKSFRTIDVYEKGPKVFLLYVQEKGHLLTWTFSVGIPLLTMFSLALEKDADMILEQKWKQRLQTGDSW